MRFRFFALAIVCFATVLPRVAGHEEVGPPSQYDVCEAPVHFVGQIFIVGNTVTKDRVIREIVGLDPGQVLRYPEVRLAERNLARLGIFRVDPERGVRPTVTILESPKSEIKDILVQVEETISWRLQVVPAINEKGDLGVKLVYEERNFDPLAIPCCLADLAEGRAFRGAGQTLRLNLMELPLVPTRVPCLRLLDGLLPAIGTWHALDGWRCEEPLAEMLKSWDRLRSMVSLN